MTKRWRSLLGLLALWGCATQTEPVNLSTAVPEAFASIPFVESGGPITPPRVVTRVEPRPSFEFVRANRSAAATAELVVDTKGNVVAAWFVEGNREFGQVFVSALRGWKFSPALLNGEALTVRTRMSSTFKNNM